MVRSNIERRLTAILCADVVGYCRLMGRDEAGTLAALMAHRSDLIDPKIAENHGRIVKSTGDGLLVEFGSVVDAVECAVQIQQGMAERNIDVPNELRLILRIGINLGDIIVEDEDIHGDGVNIAARLEELAEPGGIWVSRSVHNQVRGKVACQFRDLGEKNVKNIAHSVHVFKVALDDTDDSLATPITALHAAKGLTWSQWAAGAILVAIISASGLIWFKPWASNFESESATRTVLPLPQKPSVAVMPFTNLAGDPAQETFADGITDDLITDLSKVSGLFVIARNSTFVYKGRPVKIRQVAEALGVRYVVEGSVRRAGDTVRVNAQLIDATTGGHVWAERYDGKIRDIFRVQDDFVRKIVKALEVKLAARESLQLGQGQTSQIVARQIFQKGWEFYLRFNPEDNKKAIEHFKRAIEHDPEYGRAYTSLSLAYLRVYFFPWEDIPPSVELIGEEAYIHLDQAKKYPSALLHSALSLEHLMWGRQKQAFKDAARAISMDPNEPEAHVLMAWVLVAKGDLDEALKSVETAMRLNPKYPSHYVWTRGAINFAKADFERVVKELRTQLKQEPQARQLLPLLASAYAMDGRRWEARAALQRFKSSRSQQQLSYLSKTFHLRLFGGHRHQQNNQRFTDGLYIAALPFDVTVKRLIEDLRGDDHFKRMRAAKLLGRFGPTAELSVPALIAALEGDQDDEEVIRRAAESLGKIGPAAKGAVPALEKLTDNPRIGYYAQQSIKRIVGNR